MYPLDYFRQRPSRPQLGRCFVIMPFAQAFDGVYAAVSAAVEGDEIGFQCVRADDLSRAGHVIEAMLEEMARAEIVIADVTTRNPNVFYELGIAHMLKESSKVIILSQSIDDLPFDVRHYRCLLYDAEAAGLQRLKAALVAAFGESAEDSFVLRAAPGETTNGERLLFGPDRYMYTFSIAEVYVSTDAAKFRLTVDRHAPGAAAVPVHAQNYGITLGEQLEIPHTGWRLVLEQCDPRAGAVFRGARTHDASGVDAAQAGPRLVTRVGESATLEEVEDAEVTGMRMDPGSSVSAETEVLKGGTVRKAKGVRIVGVEVDAPAKRPGETHDR